MRVAISQPTYLPWLGYFDLLDQVDEFVLLDSVQFEKQSWQQRNRIKTPSGLLWLTVPVKFRGHFGQRICEVGIRDPEFRRKHLRSLEVNYGRAPFFDRYFPDVAEIVGRRTAGELLVDLNQRLIEWFCGVFGIQCKLKRSSSMNGEGSRSQLLVNLCRELRGDVYLSPLGSAVYLLEDLRLFSEAAIEVNFQHFEHPEYRQLFPPFCPYASALDLIFNEGENSMEIIRRGRRAAYKPGEVAACLVASHE